MANTNQHSWFQSSFLLRFLPSKFKRRLLRSQIHLPRELDPRLTFKMAETKEELSAAFRLVHNSFLAERRISPEPSGLYVTPYHSLPMTKVLLALWEGRVVGTVSLTPDSQLGLPMSSSFDVSELRKSGARIVECFALAIKTEFTHEPDKVLFPLFKYLYHFCEQYLKADYLVIAIDPQMADFYQSVLLFAPLPYQKGQLTTYHNGLPIRACYLNLKTYKLDLSAQYGASPDSANPLAFLNDSFASMQFPELESFKLTQPPMNPIVLDYFFNKRTNIFSKLPPEKLSLIAELYDADKYHSVFPTNETSQRARAVEREPRFRIQLQARMITVEGRKVATSIKDVSLSGFKAAIPEPLEFGRPVHISVAMGEFDIVDLQATPVRSDEKNDYGFCITQSHKTWQNFIYLLSNEQQNLEESLSPRFLKIS